MIKLISDQLKELYADHFNKLLLAFLFVGIVLLAVHLIHKADAGGDDANFIIWAENTAFLILGRLLGMMPQDPKSAAGGTPAATNVEKQP